MTSKGKKPELDAATVRVLRQMLTSPPKPHDEMKVGRAQKEKRGPKGRAASAKPRSA